MRYWKDILEMINNSCEHMTAEQIFFKLKEQYPAVVMATVYNNLNSLYQKGSIRKVSLEGQPDRYDRNTKHDHLFCSQCGSLSDITLEDLTSDLERQIGFHIESYDLRISYRCSKCRSS